MGDEKPLSGPITVERHFRVDGKKLTVQVTLPAGVGAEIGMEHALVAANRCIVSVESKNHKVDAIR
ncbi:MAG: hypothetical protein ACT4PT_05335 [Methanobacteriota archaeon]